MGLQLKINSIPAWLRPAKRRNRSDEVEFNSFRYEITLLSQTFDGTIQLHVEIKNERIMTIRLIKSNNVQQKLVNKAIQALSGAEFISLSNLKTRDINGQINISFSRTKN